MSKAEKLLYVVMYVLFTTGTVLAIARHDYSDAIWIIIGGMWMHNSFINRKAYLELTKELEDLN
jgi:hypothetical protein